MDAFKIFIVEDDVFYGEMLRHYLALNPDNEVHLFKTGEECLKNLYRAPAMISLDYSLPDMSGLDVMRQIKKEHTDIPVVIVSGQEDISTAVALLREGAYDYFVKDDDVKERLWNVLKKIRENVQLRSEISYLKEEIGRKYEFRNVIKGNSPSIKQIFGLIEKSIKTNISVSITGETGTGKELVAKAIHYNSKRAKKPFVAINVSAVPRDLIESEMFGHEKGAFTGAVTRKIGKFEQASGGTIFLDEIGEMDMNMQAKLLRVIQERELTRVGGNELINIDVRLIVATNRNLADEVQKGNFREDLYYRLLGLPIELPPLRYRGNDIILLAKYFVDEFCKENKMKKLSITESAQQKLMGYHFPGNVRELRAIIELAAVLTDTDQIDESHISFNSADAAGNLLMEESSLAEYTRKIISYYLQKYNNNVLLVAKKLEIGKSTIYRMIKEKQI
ncbi:MAG TPA: sigma-54 dependent transcriptional regulator [Bacteroidales bacterium]|nr:sigma-54 dependent transcriptional regulator [Bacteroidales bacterium]MDD4086829.1 sigma-54 dependent transcriptional regulator [Bacteroidales bacterium]MDY0086029.1 sigma-54 dependent transcriptional regulator [Bacteroidales bacterium]HPE43149.1 sigma-54 dependent transcriptional regulator [Bacteroidales bacterium]